MKDKPQGVAFKYEASKTVERTLGNNRNRRNGGRTAVPSDPDGIRFALDGKPVLSQFTHNTACTRQRRRY